MRKSMWEGKPCQRCGKTKGKNQVRTKYCYSCTRIVKKETSKSNHEARVLKTYQLLSGQYDELYEIQERKCAICKRATGASKRLAVDHDHKTDLVRGLLCGVCNKMLGQARDDIEFFMRAAEYLRNPPANRLSPRTIE